MIFKHLKVKNFVLFLFKQYFFPGFIDACLSKSQLPPYHFPKFAFKSLEKIKNST